MSDLDAESEGAGPVARSRSIVDQAERLKRVLLEREERSRTQNQTLQRRLDTVTDELASRSSRLNAVEHALTRTNGRLDDARAALLDRSSEVQKLSGAIAERDAAMIVLNRRLEKSGQKLAEATRQNDKLRQSLQGLRRHPAIVMHNRVGRILQVFRQAWTRLLKPLTEGKRRRSERVARGAG